MDQGIRVSARAIVLHEGNILLNCFGDGVYYNFPGGGVEAGESARQAVAREVMEEASLPVTPGPLVFVLEYEPSLCHTPGQRHQISLFFRCALCDGPDIAPGVLPDVNPDDARLTGVPVWLPVERLAHVQLVPPVAGQMLDYIRTGRFEPLFWDVSEH